MGPKTEAPAPDRPAKATGHTRANPPRASPLPPPPPPPPCPRAKRPTTWTTSPPTPARTTRGAVPRPPDRRARRAHPTRANRAVAAVAGVAAAAAEAPAGRRRPVEAADRRPAQGQRRGRRHEAITRSPNRARPRE